LGISRSAFFAQIGSMPGLDRSVLAERHRTVLQKPYDLIMSVFSGRLRRILSVTVAQSWTGTRAEKKDDYVTVPVG
jgi:hypothetical protein